MNLKAFLWFVYKLKFHVIAAFAFNVNKIYWGSAPLYPLGEGDGSPEPRHVSRSTESLLPKMGAGQSVLRGKTETRLAKPHRLPGRAAKEKPVLPMASLHSSSGPNGRCLKGSQVVMTILVLKQHSGARLPLFLGQVSPSGRQRRAI